MKKVIRALITLTIVYGLFVVSIFAFALIFELELLWVFIGFEIISLLFGFIIAASSRRKEVKISWIIFIVFIPIVGFCTYLVFGRNVKNKYVDHIYYRQLHEKLHEYYHSDSLQVLNYLENNPNNILLKVLKYCSLSENKPIFINNKLTLLKSGPDAYKSIFDDIENAKKYILINYYIIKEGELFKNLKNLLEKKLKEGVKIYLLYDHGGSIYFFHNKTIIGLQKQGMQIRCYMPLISSMIKGNIAFRNHRKDIVIDGDVGYTGGINIADEFINASPTFGFVNDQQVRIEGTAVKFLELIFANDWRSSSSKKLKDNLYSEINILSYKKQEFDLINKSSGITTVLDQGINDSSVLKNAFILLINNAKKSIWIATPYFLPPYELLEALELAARSGIDVRILLPGKTDKFLLLDISRSYCESLFNNGAKIYEFNNSFCHSKIAFFDEEVAIIGTTNLDYRSLYMDSQTMVITDNKAMVEQFKKLWEWNFKFSCRWEYPMLNYRSVKYKMFIKTLDIVSPLL